QRFDPARLHQDTLLLPFLPVPFPPPLPSSAPLPSSLFFPSPLFLFLLFSLLFSPSLFSFSPLSSSLSPFLSLSPSPLSPSLFS
ncbi:hypothetical protein ACXWRS_10905, partial [Streptococcus pyogenes]